MLAQPLSASLAAALPHWAEQQPLQEPVALAAAAGGGAPGAPAFLLRRGAGVLYGRAQNPAGHYCSQGHSRSLLEGTAVLAESACPLLGMTCW